MFFNINKFLNNPIFGLDIGYEALKLVQVNKQGNKKTLVGCVNIPLTERILLRDRFKNKAETATLLKEACRKAKPYPITAKKIVSALPETFVFSKTIQLPKMSAKDFSRAVPLEAGPYLPLPIEETYLDYQLLSTHSGPKTDKNLVDILVVASPKKLVDDYVEMVNLAGFELVGLETKPIAIGRALLSENEKNGTVVVEIGTEFSRISIWDGVSICLSTTVGTGKNQLLESLNQGNFVSDSDLDKIAITKTNYSEASLPLSNIINEVLNSIKYHCTRDIGSSKIENVLLCGSGAKIKDIEQFFEKNLKIRTRIAAPKIDGKHQLGTEYTTAYGLSIRNDLE